MIHSSFLHNDTLSCTTFGSLEDTSICLIVNFMSTSKLILNFVFLYVGFERNCWLISRNLCLQIYVNRSVIYKGQLENQSIGFFSVVCVKPKITMHSSTFIFLLTFSSQFYFCKAMLAIYVFFLFSTSSKTTHGPYKNNGALLYFLLGLRITIGNFSYY